ncbi:MAG: TRAP transporter fused permease subunit [Chloroflexota bacterium]
MEKPRLKIEDVDTTRYSRLPRPMQIVFVIMTLIGCAAAIFHILVLMPEYQMLDITYFFLIFALFEGPVFLLLKARQADRTRIPWYDYVLAFLAFSIPIFYVINSWEIDRIGWIPPHNFLQVATAAVFSALIVEGGRRIAGWVFLAVCIVFAIYPMVADYMPGVFWGKSYTIPWAISMYVYSPVGVLGLPGQIMGNLLMGFLIFAAVLMASGAGEFFLNLAIGLLGRFRGGPAKVAVVASAFFGMLSGSAAANVVSTGSFTIPTMKRIGYPPHYAGAIEACASTGGIFMPPVMGTIAFIMAAFLGIPYALVMIAAALPAILYYYGLLMGADAYAAKVGLAGLSQADLPSIRETLKRGWPFIAVLIFLTWGLVAMDWEMKSPIYATGLMILLSFTSRRTMLTPKRLFNLIATSGKLICQAMVMILPLGIIIAGLTSTGSVMAMTNAIITLAGDSTFLLLVAGAITCYILGMVGLGVPSYIFLAVTMAPAVIRASELNEIAVHLFIAYYTILSLITLPVAAAAFLGATVAGANPMKTSVTAMRLGIVVYFVPFFFVYNPALILQFPEGDPLWFSLWNSFYLFLFCIVGITLIAGSLEGYIWGIGRMPVWMRPLLAGAGFLIGIPNWETAFYGALLAIPLLILLWFINRRKRRAALRHAPT